MFILCLSVIFGYWMFYDKSSSTHLMSSFRVRRMKSESEPIGCLIKWQQVFPMMPCVRQSVESSCSGFNLVRSLLLCDDARVSQAQILLAASSPTSRITWLSHDQCFSRDIIRPSDTYRPCSLTRRTHSQLLLLCWCHSELLLQYSVTFIHLWSVIVVDVLYLLIFHLLFSLLCVLSICSQ